MAPGRGLLHDSQVLFCQLEARRSTCTSLTFNETVRSPLGVQIKTDAFVPKTDIAETAITIEKWMEISA